MDTMHIGTQLPGLTLGEITGVTVDGQPLVRCGQRRAVQALTCTTPTGAGGSVADWRTYIGRRALVAFVDGDTDRPAILGLLGVPTTTPTSTPATPRTLRISAGEELTIECGKSKIHLRADGRIEIRGEHVISRSRGPNKVKGGSVHIN